MTLCVIGKESVQELEAMIRERFSDIANKGLNLPKGEAVSDQPPFLPKEWNRLLLQAPVKDVKSLKFSWVIPWQGPHWRSKPVAYLSHLLGHEGAGSLTAQLKERGLIVSCVSSMGGWLEGAFSLLQVSFTLTDGSVHEVEEIGKSLFTYIGMLQAVGVKEWILEEMQRLRRIQFKFASDRQPFSLAASIAASLQDHPPSEALAGQFLLYDFDIPKTTELVNLLAVENVRVTHQAKVLEERCTERDTSYDSPMKLEELPDAWRQSWTAALNPGATAEAATAFAASAKLRLPPPNPFIPEDLDMKAAPSPNPTLPRRLPGAPKVVNYVFHRQDDVFMQPKALLMCIIRTPFICRDATSFLRASLWSQLVQEALSEFSYDAEIASCSYSLDAAEGAIMLSAGGFHDKLGVLIEAVAAKMLEIGTDSIESVPENFYNLVADRMADALKNQAYHSRPLSQASRRFTELTRRGAVFPVEELVEAFDASISRESIRNIVSEMFSTCHAEALVMGNETAQDALDLVKKLETSLGLKCALKELPRFEEAQLPAGRTLWMLDSTDKDDPNHAVILKWQFPKSVEVSVRLLLIGKLLSSKFFDVLRTQQQLGYIVGMGTAPSQSFTYIVAQVQSEFDPAFVRSRVDAFFDEHFAWLEDGVKEEEFQTCLRGVLSELKMKPKNLSEEFGRFQTAFIKRSYDFDRKDKQIALLESGVVDLKELQRFVREEVRAAPALYVQVRKVLDKPDKPLPEGSVIPEDPADLQVWRGYEEGVKQRDSLKTWVAMNAEIEVMDASGGYL